MFIPIVLCYDRGDHRARAVDLTQGTRIGQSWDPRCRAVASTVQSGGKYGAELVGLGAV